MTTRPKIPQRLRDQVLVRDGHRCAHVGPDGRCPAVTELEIDHICPHAHAGSDHIDNLRTFCRVHNQRAAEIVFGVEFMRRFRGENPPSSETKPFMPATGASVDSEDRTSVEALPV
jgi:5-methylcytosine-specific restriction endonuclease McrA